MGKNTSLAPLSPADIPATDQAELDQIRVALSAARKQIDMEVERRQRAEGELDRHMTEQRERMRKQLHDGLGQMLTSMSFLACTLRGKLVKCGITDTAELDEITKLINQAIAESRSIAAAFDA